MWMLLPVCCLALVNISGNHVGIIPDMASVLGNDNYMMTLYTYIIVGGILATLTAWIGVASGLDLIMVTQALYGARGKKLLAIALLSISIPASALTGGYYAGSVLQLFMDIPYSAAALVSLLIFSLLATEYNHDLLKISNCIALLLLPMLIITILGQNFSFDSVILQWGHVNWLFVLGLVGYNVGGMWSALLVETGTYLSWKGRTGVIVVGFSKIVEGVFTLGIAYLLVAAGTQGPLALVTLVSRGNGELWLSIFYVVLFCIFTNTMAPAMLVNIRQVSNLTGVSFWPSLIVVISTIYGLSFLHFTILLSIMGYTSILIILFIINTAYFLHKYGINQQ